MLVRSTSKDWSYNSLLSVDSGCLLASLAKIIEESTGSDAKRPVTLKTGPLKGLTLPHVNKNANAIHIAVELIQSFVVTHPHLDHTSGFIFATAGMDPKRQKTLAALGSTLEGFRKHIFNGIIWPNLSDQHAGFKMISYYELTHGGHPHIEDGGYVTLADGLEAMYVLSPSPTSFLGSFLTFSAQFFMKNNKTDFGFSRAMQITHGHCLAKHFEHTLDDNLGLGFSYPIPLSTPTTPFHPKTPLDDVSEYRRYNPPNPDGKCATDSTAVFIRDSTSKEEILIFGDVEPDSLSIRGLNIDVWDKAAPKIASGQLKAIFIESSYTDSRPDQILFGHLTPKYIFEELKVLAGKVETHLSEAHQSSPRKRKPATVTTPSRRQGRISKAHTSSRHKTPISQTSDNLHQLSVQDDVEMTSPTYDGPLSGIKVIIIHVKDQAVDGPDPRVTIRAELKAHEERERLGAHFIVSESGDSYYI